MGQDDRTLKRDGDPTPGRRRGRRRARAGKTGDLPELDDPVRFRASVHRAQPYLLRQMNERRVFDLIRCYGPASRADLRRQMSISTPTISKAVARLTEAGLLEEVGAPPSRGVGRPFVVYQLARASVQVLGATLGPQRCVVVSAALDGSVDGPSVISFPPPATYAELIKLLADAARKLMRRDGVRTLGVGLTVPGSVDARAGRVLISSHMHLLDGRSPGRDLQRKLRLEVCLVRDMIGVALADLNFGPAAEFTDFIRLGARFGFGVSIVSGGRPLEGCRGLAGELGHVTVDPNGELCGCGNRGCLETVANDAALIRAVSKRLGRLIDIEELLRLSAAGELDAGPELDRAMEYLAIGAAAAINLFNPQVVLINARMFDLEADAFERFKEMVARRALKPPMDDSRLIRAGPIGQLGAVAAIIGHLTHSLGPVVH